MTVTVRTAGENSAPIQVQDSKTTVVEGWSRDDPGSRQLGRPRWRPHVRDAGLRNRAGYGELHAGWHTRVLGRRNHHGREDDLRDGVGRQGGDDGSLSVTVRADGKVPIIADPFLQIATAGQPITISPLVHVRGGNAPLRLGNVPAKADVTITPSYDAGTFQFESASVGTHYLELRRHRWLRVADRSVRVDVIAPPESNTKPITDPQDGVRPRPRRSDRRRC